MPDNKKMRTNILVLAIIAVVIAAGIFINEQNKPDVSIDLPNGKSLTIDVDK